jgi:hypothetical protein
MGSEVIILPIIFGTIITLCYFYFSSRNKERMALIDKGAEASIFFSSKPKTITPLWKVVIINLATLAMGIGIGIVIGGVLDYSYGIAEEIAYPSAIFILGGLGLLGGFMVTKKFAELN